MTETHIWIGGAFLLGAAVGWLAGFFTRLFDWLNTVEPEDLPITFSNPPWNTD